MTSDELTLWLFYGCVLVALLSPLNPLLARREAPREDVMPPLLLVAALSSLGYVAWAIDDFSALSASWIFVAVFAAWGGGLAWAVERRRRSRTAAAMGVVFVAAIVGLHYLDLTPKKPYRRFYFAVHDGMTRADVFDALHREFPDGGRFPVPTVYGEDAVSLIFGLDPNDGRWNAEDVEIWFSEGRVSGKDYRGD